jgi:hypothetical protein
MQRKAITLASICALVFIFVATQKTAADVSYFVEGIESWTNFNDQGGVGASGQFDFRIDVSGRLWSIKMKPEPPDKGGEDYELVKSDGTNIYYLRSIETFVRSSKGSGTAPNIANGIVVKGAVPNYMGFDGIGPLWLTYASQEFFGSISTNRGKIEIPCGMWTMSGQCIPLPPVVVVRRAEWELSEVAPFVPNWAVWFEEGESSVLRLGKPEIREHYPPPYDKGFTNTIFVAVGTTNVGTLGIPLGAQINTYGFRRKTGKSAGDLWVREVYQISTKNQGLEPSIGEIPPKLPGITAVNDSRFVTDTDSPKAKFSYMATNNFYTDEEAHNLREYKLAHDPQFPVSSTSFYSPPASNKASPVKRRIIGILLCVAFALPLMGVIKWRRQK